MEQKCPTGFKIKVGVVRNLANLLNKRKEKKRREKKRKEEKGKEKKRKKEKKK